MVGMDARALLLAAAISLGPVAPADAVYRLAGMFQLNPSTDNYGASADNAKAAFAVDQQGNVFVLNTSAPFVTKYSATGQQLAQFGSTDQVSEPKAIATDATGGVYLADKARVDENGGVPGRVAVFSTAGSYQRTITYDETIYGRGAGFTVDGTGHIYLAEVDTQIIDGSGKQTGKISYGRVDATDLGALAGDPAGSGVYGRSNASQGEAVFRFDAAGAELSKLASPGSGSNVFDWHADGLAADTKGNLIVIDTYCLAAVVFRGQTLTDAAYLGSLLTPGKKAQLRGVAGTDAAGDIFVEVVWGDGTYHIARLVPGSGSGALPRKGCRALPGGGTETPPSPKPASAQFSVPAQSLQNRRFELAVTCPSACNVLVSATAMIAGRRYAAGRATKQLTSGTVGVTIPKRTYRRIVRRLKAGRGVKLLLSLAVRYADGSTSSKQVTLPLKGASGGGRSTWSGNWTTDFGAMRLTQSGSTVTGNYASCDGTATVSGTLTGRTLDGTWSQSCNSRSGRMHFVMSADGTSFTGLWSYGNAAPDQAWNGQRT